MTMAQHPSMHAYFNLPRDSMVILAVLQRFGPLPVSELEQLAILKRSSPGSLPAATVKKLAYLGLIQSGPIGQLDITKKGRKLIQFASDLADPKRGKNMSSEKVSLRNFIEAERKKLIIFEAYWSAHHKENPEQYPIENTLGDWDEQVAAFSENLYDRILPKDKK